MKIRVGDLKPNPFRKIKSYPISKEKVDSLKKSMKETGFWDNILARKKDGYFEIAYGHHRLKAIKLAFGNDFEVNIPVKNLDDATILRIMANENDQDYNTSPSVLIETLDAARKFISKNPSIVGKKEVAVADVTAIQISRFLGGNWDVSKVGYGLQAVKMMLDDKVLDQEAVKNLPTQGSLRNFVKALNRAKTITGRNVPKPSQRAIAKDAATEKLGASEIKDRAVASVSRNKKLLKRIPEINDWLDGEFLRNVRWLNKRLKVINEHKGGIEALTKQKMLPHVKLLMKQMNELFEKGERDDQVPRSKKLLQK